MNIDQAAINLSNILNDARIETPKGPLTAREHQQLAGDLSLLIKRAQKADELQKQINEERQATKAPKMPDKNIEEE